MKWKRGLDDVEDLMLAGKSFLYVAQMLVVLAMQIAERVGSVAVCY